MSIQSNRWSRSRNCISAPIYVWIIYIEGRKTVTFPIFLHFYNWIKKNIISKYKWKISFFPFIIILQLLNYCIYLFYMIYKEGSGSCVTIFFWICRLVSIRKLMKSPILSFKNKVVFLVDRAYMFFLLSMKPYFIHCVIYLSVKLSTVVIERVCIFNIINVT